MNWPLLVPLLTTTVVAILGWFAAHRLSAARDRANKRREFRLPILHDAYRALEHSAHTKFEGATAEAVCKAFADIQIVGSAEQVNLALQLMADFSSRQETDWQPLLLSLRRDLRAELGLPPLPDTLLHLRIQNLESSDSRVTSRCT